MRKKDHSRIQSGGRMWTKVGGLVSSETNVGGSGRSNEKQKTKCRRMWPQALADWRAKKKNKKWSFPELEAMMRRKLGLIENSAEQPVPMQM